MPPKVKYTPLKEWIWIQLQRIWRMILPLLFPSLLPLPWLCWIICFGCENKTILKAWERVHKLKTIAGMHQCEFSATYLPGWWMQFWTYLNIMIGTGRQACERNNSTWLYEWFILSGIFCITSFLPCFFFYNKSPNRIQHLHTTFLLILFFHTWIPIHIF